MKSLLIIAGILFAIHNRKIKKYIFLNQKVHLFEEMQR